MDKYEALWACYKSEQIPVEEFLEIMQNDIVFRRWVMQQIKKEREARGE